jgi:peptide deformylase
MPIVQVGDKVLRHRAAEVPRSEIGGERIKNLIAALRETLAKTPGVGVAAPQIGVSLRIVLIQDLSAFHETIPPERLAELERSPIEPYVLINPELELVDTDERTFFESCLSVGEAGFSALVRRRRTVRVRYVDPNGKEHLELQSGWHARILQHEVDHLNGVLFVDDMFSRTLMSAEHCKVWAHISTEEVLQAFAIE